MEQNKDNTMGTNMSGEQGMVKLTDGPETFSLYPLIHVKCTKIYIMLIVAVHVPWIVDRD